MRFVSTIEQPSASAWLLERVPGRSAVAIGVGVAGLIESGELAPGTQLPTIREFARATGTSVGTILSAWSTLRAGGLITTNRRGGTVVAGPTPATAAPVVSLAGLDLAQNAPDISLQPDLREALIASLDANNLNVFGRDQMTAELLATVQPGWPFAPDAWATAGGGTEALLLAIGAAAPPGSTILVDQPLGPGVIDTIRDLGLTAWGLENDEHGPTVESLREGLALRPAAFVFQPGAPYAVFHSVTPERVRELAAVLEATGGDTWIIEDDSIGPLAASEPPSLGSVLPSRVLRIRSYCKAFGIDVRTSVLGGARQLVDRSMQLRSHGVGSNSRILQNTLAYLIESADAARSVAIARDRYANRKAALLAALERLGVTARSGPGSLIIWVDVPDETTAIIALAREGIAVGAASKSFAAPLSKSMLRVSVTLVPDDAALVEALARSIAAASAASSREYAD